MSMIVLRTVTGTLAGVPARHGSTLFNSCSTPRHASNNGRFAVELCSWWVWWAFDNGSAGVKEAVVKSGLLILSLEESVLRLSGTLPIYLTYVICRRRSSRRAGGRFIGRGCEFFGVYLDFAHIRYDQSTHLVRYDLPFEVMNAM